MPRPLDEKLLNEIKRLPQVAQAAGQINDVAAVVGKDGKIVKTGGAPTIAATYMPKPFAAVGISKGRPPHGADEIALDAATADKENFKLGDEVTVATTQPKRPFKLVGLATIGQSAGLGGATFVVFDLATAQALFDKPGKVDFAYVAGRPGISQADLQAPDRRAAAADRPGAHRRAGGRQARRGHPPGPLLPHHRPARVRLHRRARRRVPDLQHVLDHRRAALARARAAAHARRHAAPGAQLRAARGAHHRPDRLGRRHPRRPRLREGDQRALQGARHRPPDHEPRARAAHDHRLPARRHARHAGRRARARRCGRRGSPRSRRCARPPRRPAGASRG